MNAFGRPVRPVDLAVTAAFIALLLAPALLALTGHAGSDTEFIRYTELREPFVAPPITSGALATGGWERDAERELADAFPLRQQLILGNDYVTYAWLDDVASPLVIRGRDNWLFLGAPDERTFLAGGPSDAALAHVADVYAARSAWCAKHGLRYIFVLAPNKSTIYARELLDGIAPVMPSGADRLFAMLRARHVAFVDPRRALIEASHTGEVYSKGDTHWNDAGAYIAYAQMAQDLRIAAIPRRSVRVSSPSSVGDLQKMAGVPNVVPNPWVRYRFPQRARTLALPAAATRLTRGHVYAAASAIDDPSLPTLVAFGDSFIEPLRPFLDESFRRAIVLHHAGIADAQFDEPLLTSEKPSVVLQVLAERNLVYGNDFQALK